MAADLESSAQHRGNRQSYHSRVVERVKELGYAVRAGELTIELSPRVRLLLRRGPGGRVRLQDPRALPRQAHPPVRRDHPQRRRGRAAREDGHLHPAPGGPARDALRRGAARGRAADAGLRGDGGGVRVPSRARLRAGGHHLRQRAERLEERPALHAGRLHVGDHGKHYHEETRATASQGSPYLCVRDRDEAELVCRAIRGELPGEALVERLGAA